MVRHFVQEYKVAWRDEWCAKMIGVDFIDTFNICRKCRPGISRGCYGYLPGLLPAGTVLFKDWHMTGIAPA
jgi:hypothetical protein